MAAVALNSFRSHFSKHLSCTNIATTFSFFSRRITPPRTTFSFLLSPTKKSLPLHSLSLITTFATSSSPSASLTTDPISSPYLSARIFCQKDFADILSEALLSFGANSTTVDEQNDEENYNEICISSIFPISEDVEICISRAANSVGLNETPKYQVEFQDHTNWIQKIQESFNPVKVKDGLWIVPEWETPLELEATNIILNPGLAFGTGEHPTTKLCLLLLHNLVKGGENLLDYGTGSGILAIAGLKFGACYSVGIDIDPEAIKSARYNANLNNIEPEKFVLNLSSEIGDDMKNGKYEIVVANILMNPLLELADRIVCYAKPGGIVGLSGILSEQVSIIVERYSVYLEGITVTELDGWACLSGSKK